MEGSCNLVVVLKLVENIFFVCKYVFFVEKNGYVKLGKINFLFFLNNVLILWLVYKKKRYYICFEIFIYLCIIW